MHTVQTQLCFFYEKANFICTPPDPTSLGHQNTPWSFLTCHPSAAVAFFCVAAPLQTHTPVNPPCLSCFVPFGPRLHPWPPLFPSNPPASPSVRPQLSLRVKALKRQVDESEGEVERLEGVRRKVLRDLEEQQELQEALHAKVSALETELK